MPRLMDCAEVASLLKISKRGVQRLAFEGDLPHVYVGKLLRFEASEITRWVLSLRGTK